MIESGPRGQIQRPPESKEESWRGWPSRPLGKLSMHLEQNVVGSGVTKADPSPRKFESGTCVQGVPRNNPYFHDSCLAILKTDDVPGLVCANNN